MPVEASSGTSARRARGTPGFRICGAGSIQ